MVEDKKKTGKKQKRSHASPSGGAGAAPAKREAAAKAAPPPDPNIKPQASPEQQKSKTAEAPPPKADPSGADLPEQTAPAAAVQTAPAGAVRDSSSVPPRRAAGHARTRRRTENRWAAHHARSYGGARKLWAKTQSAGVTMRYRVGKRVSAALSRGGARLARIPLLYSIAEGLYSLGFGAEYMLVRLSRLLRVAAAALLAAGGRVWQLLKTYVFPEFALVFRELFGPFYILFRGLYRLHRHGREARRQRGFFAGIAVQVRYLWGGIRKNAHLVPKSFAYIIPLAALAGMIVTVRTMLLRPYTLAVQVNGETVGYVANEGVFDSARENVLERIIYADGEEGRWNIEASYTLALSPEVMDENQMADTIMQSSSDEISQGTALYVDGKLTAICAEGAELRRYLKERLEPYEDSNDETLKVRFSRDIRLMDGIYLNDNFKQLDAVLDYLNGVQQETRYYTVREGDSLSLIASNNGLTVSELCSLNSENGIESDSMLHPGDVLAVTRQEAVLEVWVTRTVSWQEEIPYSTEKSNSSNYAFGTVNTVQKGVPGVREYTAVNTYDGAGNLLEQEIVGNVVLQPPVPEKIVTGTRLPNGSVAKIGSGTLIWPVPAYRYCSRWASTGHKGVDICAPAGTPIYAADSGVVTKSGYERGGLGTGYGYSVLINHGGGYSTAYAHMLSNLQVSVGQSVSQGQLVGYMGSTGRSTGNHLHFEIRYNGAYLPPQNYFKK